MDQFTINLTKNSLNGNWKHFYLQLFVDAVALWLCLCAL